MRHAKHRHQLGRKKEHRQALMANMAVAIILNKRIKTTQAKAKALRPFIEKIITLAKKAHATDDKLRKHHYRKLALRKVRDIRAINRLFNDLAEQFANRDGGYTRIYKLIPRKGDAADMALIEMIDADDEGYSKRKSKPAAKKAAKEETEAAAVEATEEVAAEVEAPEVAEESAPEAEATSEEAEDAKEEDAAAPEAAAEEPAAEEESADDESSEAAAEEAAPEPDASADAEPAAEEDSQKEEK